MCSEIEGILGFCVFSNRLFVLYAWRANGRM